MGPFGRRENEDRHPAAVGHVCEHGLDLAVGHAFIYEGDNRAGREVDGGQGVVVSGMVYAPDGSPANGAFVTANSLLPSSPYTATVTTSQGQFVFNNLPSGVSCEILATKDHWQTAWIVFAGDCGYAHKLALHAQTQWPVLSDDAASAAAP